MSERTFSDEALRNAFAALAEKAETHADCLAPDQIWAVAGASFHAAREPGGMVVFGMDEANVVLLHSSIPQFEAKPR